MRNPDIKNLPDPYLQPWERDLTERAKKQRAAIDRRAIDSAEAETRRRNAVLDFERRLAERDRLDNITLWVCAAIMLVVGLVVWWMNS